MSAVLAGVLAGITWAVETLLLGIALSMSPLCSTQQAAALAPFASTFLHDLFSALWLCLYNALRGRLPDAAAALRTKSGRFAALAAIIGGPVGMTGYMLCVANMGASIGAVASAVYPAVGAVLSFFFLKKVYVHLVISHAFSFRLNPLCHKERTDKSCISCIFVPCRNV